jgi:hypothetical protein
MQQLDTLRERVTPAGKWFRVGVMSATAVAPLIARWNDLRADKRAAELREQAEARLLEARERLRSGAAGVMRQAAPLAERVPIVQLKSRRRPNTGLWLAGVAVGLLAAGVTAYIVARRRLAVPEEEEPMVELPLDVAVVTLATTPQSANGVAEQVPMGQAEGAAAAAETPGEADSALEIDSAEDVASARYVGNIHTMIYHDVGDAAHLPAEENRIYFATEEEAEEAGFQRARSGVAFGEQAQPGEGEWPSA